MRLFLLHPVEPKNAVAAKEKKIILPPSVPLAYKDIPDDEKIYEGMMYVLISGDLTGTIGKIRQIPKPSNYKGDLKEITAVNIRLRVYVNSDVYRPRLESIKWKFYD